MPRFASLIVGFVLVASAGARQPADKQAEDKKAKIAAELQKAKETYQKTADEAAKTLTDAFDMRIKDIERTTSDIVVAKAKTKQLREEKEVFQADQKRLPESPEMKAAKSGYLVKIKGAESKCQAAFDMAITDYKSLKDEKAAEIVLEQKELFFPYDFAGRYRRVRDNIAVHFTTDGLVWVNGKQEGAWKGTGHKCEVAWKSGWTLELRPVKGSKNLTGTGRDPEGKIQNLNVILVPDATKK